VALCRSHAGNGCHGCRSSRAKGSGGVAVGSHGVGDWGLVEAVGAVVVADEDVGVGVAEADVVVAVLLAGGDAGLVAVDTGVDDAVDIALVCVWHGSCDHVHDRKTR
jgi:hypothetical protein